MWSEIHLLQVMYVIEGGKYVFGFRVPENSFSSRYPLKILAKVGLKDDPIATSSVCLYIVLLKLNSTEDVANK